MARSGRPAVLGGEPAFPEGLPLVRPTVDAVPAVARRIESILDSGMLTNGPTVRELEEVVADRLGTHVVAVSSCTTGLMLTYQAIGVTGRVVLPSFTFSASAHAVVWAGGGVDFADVEADRGTLDPAAIEELVDGADAISATHLYGAPCEVERLEAAATAAGVPIVYDAAHALGSARQGVPIGRFGLAEVFSLSPTKVVVAGEGGLVSTADEALAGELRIARDYGNPGNYDTRFAGLNGRLSELHAAVALASFAHLDEHLVARGELVDALEASLEGVPGLRIMRPAGGDTSTYKDLTLVVDREAYGLDAGLLQRALAAEGIDTRRYYSPPVHSQQSYADRWATARRLPVTDYLAASVLSPPLWSHMQAATVKEVGRVIGDLHAHCGAVAVAIGGTS